MGKSRQHRGSLIKIGMKWDAFRRWPVICLHRVKILHVLEEQSVKEVGRKQLDGSGYLYLLVRVN
jgi:hypothetical protein